MSNLILTDSSQDEEIITKFYWNKFFNLFPELEYETFIQYLNEDYYGGWEETNHFHAGGRRELKMLYITLRVLKPKNILEIGTYDGRSTDHILLAAENNTKDGYECNVTTVDISDYVKNRELHPFPINRIIESSLLHLSHTTKYDFVFQDGDHTSKAVHSELTLFENLPNLKGLFSHDYYLHSNTIKKVFEAYPINKIFSKCQPFQEDAYKAGFHIAVN
jgi:hypothetical protein